MIHDALKGKQYTYISDSLLGKCIALLSVYPRFCMQLLCILFISIIFCDEGFNVFLEKLNFITWTVKEYRSQFRLPKLHTGKYLGIFPKDNKHGAMT